MRKIKKEKLLIFFNELSVMLKSGIPFSNALSIIMNEEKDVFFRKIIFKIQRDINKGKGIFESFSSFKYIFDENYLFLIKIGEKSGNLTEKIDDIILSLNFEIKNIKKFRSILIYPLIIIFLCLFVVSFIMIFIFPNFVLIFEENNINLPFITKFLIKISKNFNLILLIIISILLISLRFLKFLDSKENTKVKKDFYYLNLLAFGKIYKLNYAIRIYSSISVLLSSGISIIEALDIISSNINNLYIKNNLIKVSKHIISGNSISSSFKYLDLFNEKFNSFILSGEESGFLAENLMQISKLLELEFQYKTKNLLSFLEPLIMIIIGIFILIIVLAIYLPLFSLSNLI